MNTIWSSLLWKEWREHRWKILAVTIIVVVLQLVASIGSPGRFFHFLPTALTIYALAAGVLFGMGAGAGENSAGTIRFLQSLPTKPVKPAVVKLVWAAAAVAIPVLVIAVLAFSWQTALVGEYTVGQLLVNEDWKYQLWEHNGLVVPTWALVGALSILLWSAAAGVNRSDEVRAAAIAILVILAYWAGLSWFSEGGDGPLWFRFLVGGAPGGPGVIVGWMRSPPTPPYPYVAWLEQYWPEVAGAIVMHLALVGWYVARFGRLAPGKRQEIENDQAVDVKPDAWLAPPRRSPLSAIIWKQVRESAPLALLGAGLIVLMAVMAQGIGFMKTKPPQRNAEELLAVAFVAWVFTGFFVAIVAGVGVFMDDLRPGIHAFWRSRPVRISQWFFVKFVVGLVVTIVTLAAAPTFLVVVALPFIRHADAKAIAGGWLAWQRLGQFFLIQAGLYAAAVAAMVLLRHALYAALAAMAIPFAVLIATEWAMDFLDLPWVFANAVVVLLIIDVVAGAWLALEKDWSLRR